MLYNVGQSFDRSCRVADVLEGGMALVYVLEHVETKGRIAAKTIREEFLGDPVMVARFRREMKIWVGLGAHTCIVRALSVKDIGTNPFLFMDYMDRGSLHSFMKTTHIIPFEKLLQIARSVAGGMNYIHNCITPDGLRGIIHRDLTPANVMLNSLGEVKIADFGLARAADSTMLTRTFDVLGTFPYASPEQLFEPHDVDKRTDIYSFGASLYHAACARPPFAGTTWPDLVKKIKNSIPSPPARLRNDIPEPFSQIIMKCMAKARDERYGSFSEIVAALCDLFLERETDKQETDGVEAQEMCEILDKAEQEAIRRDRGFVDAADLFLSVVTVNRKLLSRPLREAQIEEEKFVSHLQNFADEISCEGSSKTLRYKRSTRRAVATARTLAEKEGDRNPNGKYLLKALFEEPRIREMVVRAIGLLGAKKKNLERFFELMEKE